MSSYQTALREHQSNQQHLSYIQQNLTQHGNRWKTRIHETAGLYCTNSRGEPYNSQWRAQLGSSRGAQGYSQWRAGSLLARRVDSLAMASDDRTVCRSLSVLTHRHPNSLPKSQIRQEINILTFSMTDCHVPITTYANFHLYPSFSMILYLIPKSLKLQQLIKFHDSKLDTNES
jgi:hypothetical protein